MQTKTYNFQAYPAIIRARFICTICEKPNRTKTLRVECTVNPFNTHDDGTPRTPSEVRKQSQEQVSKEYDLFMTQPVCTTCENCLSYSERKALREKRHNIYEGTK